MGDELTFSVQYLAMSSLSFCTTLIGSLNNRAAVKTSGISFTWVLNRRVELTESRFDVEAESYPESEYGCWAGASLAVYKIGRAQV